MSDRMSRRSLLHGIAATAIASKAFPGTGRPGSSPGSNDPIDVAIVGGGVAGSYAAWRLASDPGFQGSIRIFERSDRIGGRLHSVRCAGLKDQVAELGGMRIAGDQLPLLGLVKELGLETEPYPATEGSDLYYVRGIRTRAEDMRYGTKVGFRSNEELDGKQPGEVFRHVLRTLTGRDDWDAESFRAARDSLEYKGMPLVDMPYEYAYREVLGSEGFKFLHHTTGYGRPNLQALAFVEEAALSLFVDRYHHVRGGYDQVPRRLADAAKARGVDIRFGSTLVDLRFDDDGLARLVFDEHAGPTGTVRARRVIMAIPGSAYELLDPSGALGGDSGISRANRHLEADDAVKIYSNYATQWWKPAGMKVGRSITDLPIRQCFYLPDSSDGGLVLSPYASGSRATGYWKPLLEPSAPNRLSTDGVAARAIRDQLGRLHGFEVPQAREIHYRMFDGGHVGDGWSMWSPGSRYWEILPDARTPVPGRPVHCVGQATAAFQGWVMGTIASVESVMRGAYGLRRPDWWPPSHPVD